MEAIRTKQSLIEWRDYLTEKRKKGNVKNIKSDYVFCRISGERINRFDTAWRKVCKIAGFEGLHFHDIRHTFCSNLILSGGSLKDAKEMIGHSDLSMTDRYSHLVNTHKLSKQQALAEFYSKKSKA